MVKRETYKLDLNPVNTPLELECSPATVITKGWGRTEDGVGEIFVYHEPQEDKKIEVKTVKTLYLAKNRRLSRHLHLKKEEIFFTVLGEIEVEVWNRDGEKTTIIMRPDNRLIIPVGTQHRMTGRSDINILLEVSSLDTPEDSIRIERGD